MFVSREINATQALASYCEPAFTVIHVNSDTSIASMILSTLTHTDQREQQPSEGDHSHEGSRAHAPQHCSQAEGRDEHTIIGIYLI
jgi:hypothetical protein